MGNLLVKRCSHQDTFPSYYDDWKSYDKSRWGRRGKRCDKLQYGTQGSTVGSTSWSSLLRSLVYCENWSRRGWKCQKVADQSL